MGKQPKSTTQNTFPPWLMKSLQPLISGATRAASGHMAGGQNVLHPGGGGGAQQGGGNFDPRLLDLLNRNIAGGPAKGGGMRRAAK